MVRFRRMTALGLFLAVVHLPLISQTLLVTIRGTVRDSATGEALSAATIRLLGTARGTIANAEGMFAIDVPIGTSTLVVSSLAYSPDTLAVSSAYAGSYDILLAPSAIILPEVVVSSEDPALAIIRRAIARKHLWIDRLVSYSMDAFTRQILMRDTAIASITEAMTRGYWRAGDTLREVIVQRRQTRNVNESFNFAAVGVLLNFNQDHIRFVGYDFVGPTADDALDYYDYRLLRTRVSHGREIFDIAMLPRVRTHPLFKGTVSIAGDTYALVGVDVEPNEAFGMPFVRDFSIRYQQQFGLFDSTFWMPVDIRIRARVSIGIPGITLPPIGFEQISAISSYAVNVPLADSIFRKPRITVDSLAARPDSAAWAAHATVPMTLQEREAYQSLDSGNTLEVQFRPGGLAATLSGGDGTAWALLSHLDLAFNRVEGGHLGLSGSLDSVSPYVVPHAGWAYAFAARNNSWEIGATLFTDRNHHLGIGGSVYRRYTTTPAWRPYEPLFNALAALFAKEDVYDYYRAEGWNAAGTFAPSPVLSLRLTYTDEEESSVSKITNYSILYPARPFRNNPPADDGRMRSVRFDLRLGREALPIDLIAYDGLGVAIEHSGPGLLGSAFHFTQYNAYATFSFVTFGRSFLFKPQLRVRASAGTSTGTLPLQRYFSVETGAAGTAAFGAMYAMKLKEFRGTSYAALEVEHNFRSIPFLLLGIPQSVRHNLELVLHAGMANSWGQGIFPRHPDGWYYEAGFGLSRILDLFRMDLTWRLSSPGGLAVSVGVANLF
jgi:hypothetical protein